MSESYYDHLFVSNGQRLLLSMHRYLVADWSGIIHPTVVPTETLIVHIDLEISFYVIIVTSLTD